MNTSWIRASAIGVVLWFGGPLSAQASAAAAVQGTPIDTRIGMHAERATAPLQRRVSLDLRNARLETALEAINRQAKLGLSYTAQLVPLDKQITVHVDSITAGEALTRVLQGTGVSATETRTGTVMLVKRKRKPRSESRADTTYGAVWGRVVDSVTARPLNGAVVNVKGTDIAAMTNEQGRYILTAVPAGVRVITARMLGYIEAEREVPVVDSQLVRVDFALRMGMSRLQEVVTTATGPKRRLEIPNDITVIDVDSVMATAPVASVTDLLEARVPGLVVQHTSGAPGDPSRLRLRGVSSVYRSNDPIVIVDGIRVYYNQSAERSANLAGKFGVTGAALAAPSPLDQLDPHSIATIEVLKGPSAATLYGADAANGVIVITTKKGRPGPARWTMSATRGRSFMPGQYPVGFYRWGHDYLGNVRLCALTDFACTVDSLVRFQALNDPQLTVLGHGRRTELSLGVSGGTRALTYALTGSYADETGILTLPGFEVRQFRALHGQAPPGWMQRPQTHTRWSGTSRLGAQLGQHAQASLTTTLTHESQQRSDLERQLSALMGTYADQASETYYRLNGPNLLAQSSLVPDFYQRATAVATNFTNAASVTWQLRSWLTASAGAGLNVIGRQDAILLPQGVTTRADSIGRLSSARGNSVVSTVNLRATATTPRIWGFRLQFATGANYTKKSIADLATAARGLAPGTTSLNGASTILLSTERVNDITNLGWYVEPSISHKRFFLSAGLRFDGGSSYGTHVNLPTFPKLGGSWLISDEPWFPLKQVVDVLRLRAAYGHAGVQPGPAARLRLYTPSRPWLDGSLTGVTRISTLGNTKLKPERSEELEGGFDVDLLDSRLSVSFSGYRKIRKDALMNVPVAPSVYGDNVTVLKNIGVIRNTGFELRLGTQLVRSDPVTWSATLNMSRNHNTVVALGPGVEPFNISDAGRVAPGYPLFGRWARPILTYADANENGIIEASEVQIGDSLVFMGETVPNYEASLHTTFSLFRGMLTLNAGFDYQDGLTQVNETIKDNRFLSQALNDASAPFSEQAAVAVIGRTDYGLMQTISMLRVNSLSVAFNAPPSLARRLGARSLSLAVQGENVGLYTNYTGKDPNVNAYSTGNGVVDTGVLPMPRTWLLTVRVGY